VGGGLTLLILLTYRAEGAWRRIGQPEATIESTPRKSQLS